MKYRLNEKTRNKLPKFLIHQNDSLWPLLQLQRLSAFIPRKTGGRMKIVLPSFPTRVARHEHHLRVISIKFIPHQPNGIYVRWLHRLRYQLKDMLFLLILNYVWQSLRVFFWVIILLEYKSLDHKLCSRYDHVILQYSVIAGLIQFALHVMQILDFAIAKSCHPPTIKEIPPCFKMGVIQVVAALSPTPHCA